MSSQIQKLVGIVVCFFTFILASIEFIYFSSFEEMSLLNAFRQPSVFAVIFTGIVFLLTAISNSPLLRILQVLVIILSSYFSSLTAMSGDLTSLIIFIIGYVLAIEYGFFSTLFQLKSVLVIVLYLISLFYGLYNNEESQLIVTIHSVIGAGLVSSLMYIVIWAQIKRDRLRAKELELKVAEQTRELRKALSQKETLLREVHHRTKNNMQLISSLINLEYIDVEDESAKMSADISMRRIQSLSIAHEYLHQSENIKNINLKDYIDGFLSVIASDFSGQNVEIISSIDEDIVTNIEGAIPLGLIVNELVTNSFKYAFNDTRKGEISIKMYKQQKQLLIFIEDNGSGMPEIEDIEKSESLGLQIVVKLLNQIDGDYIVHQNNGTSWQITVPLNDEDNESFSRPVFFIEKDQDRL